MPQPRWLPFTASALDAGAGCPSHVSSSTVNRKPLPVAPTRFHFVLLASALLTLTAYGSIIPLRYEPVPLATAIEQVREAKWFPARLEHSAMRADWTVNSLQYATLSFFCLGALAVDRSRWIAALLAIGVAAAGCALAFWLEVLQVSFPPRTISAGDVWVESVGTLIGCVAWLAVGPVCTGWARRFWTQRGLVGLANQILPGYLVLQVIVNGMPFDFVHAFDELERRLETGRVELLPFQHLILDRSAVESVSDLLNFASFVPVGLLLGIIPRWADQRIRTTVVIGIAWSVAIECLQLFVGSRYFKATDIVLGSIAVWLAARWIRQFDGPLQRGFPLQPQGIEVRFRRLRDRLAGWGRGPWLVLLVVWMVVLLLLSWQPYEFHFRPSKFLRSDPDLSDEDTPVYWLRRMSFFPLADYYYGSRYQTLDQFLRRGLSFLPLGVLGAILFPKRRRFGLVVTVGFGLVFGTVIELGQYFIPQRHPGVTDLCIHLFAAWLGFMLASHVAKAVE